MSGELLARITDTLDAHKVIRVDRLDQVDAFITCKCDAEVSGGLAGWNEHRAAMMSPVITEAHAEGLREAAAIVASEEATQWRDDRGGVYGVRIPGAQIVAQRMQVVGKIITTRADKLVTP